MYLHVGNGKSVRLEKIIGIFDLDTATVSSVGKRFITEAEKRKEVEYDYLDLPRTFVVKEEESRNKREKKKYKIILSRISTSGLLQRAEGEENN
jgi:hypothetical protein